MEKKSKKRSLIVASIAGLMVVTGAAIANASSSHATADACYGVNQCKGTGACGGKTHGCAGKNACKGQGWVHMDNDECLAIEGGSLTPIE